MGEWWNGLHKGLKNPGPRLIGSNPISPTMEKIIMNIIEYECKCGHDEDMDENIDIEWYVCIKCKRIGCWNIREDNWLLE